MELRYSEIDRARNIYERYVQCIPSVKAWVRYAKFEMKNGQVGLARKCYERAVGEMGEDAQTVSLISVTLCVSFARSLIQECESKARGLVCPCLTLACNLINECVHNECKT